jgi:hypothetical protein
MKHPSCQDLFAYWDARRGLRAVPERGDIEPGAIRHLLGDTFILGIGGGADDAHPFRLAGTRVCALFGRELKGESFAGLWAAASRKPIGDLVAVVMDESVGLVAGASALNEAGAPLELELLLLPLGGRRPGHARAIGVLAPMRVPDWLGTSRLGGLVLGSRRHVGPELKSRPAPRFMAATGRLRHGLVVHEGGRT